jgi:hypothetical protein
MSILTKKVTGSSIRQRVVYGSLSICIRITNPPQSPSFSLPQGLHAQKSAYFICEPFTLTTSLSLTLLLAINKESFRGVHLRITLKREARSRRDPRKTIDAYQWRSCKNKKQKTKQKTKKNIEGEEKAGENIAQVKKTLNTKEMGRCGGGGNGPGRET